MIVTKYREENELHILDRFINLLKKKVEVEENQRLLSVSLQLILLESKLKYPSLPYHLRAIETIPFHYALCTQNPSFLQIIR